MQIETTLIPLNLLTVSPLNPRQTINDAEVKAMAASIMVMRKQGAGTGLLQNLLGLSDGDGAAIVGGGIRLRALQFLSENGDIPAEEPIPVKTTDDESNAIEWANAENAARNPLEPADEIVAYRDLRKRGINLEHIAAAHAVSVPHVRRRLKLADLPESAINALRDKKISISAAQDLTVSDDAVQVSRTVDALLKGELHPNSIKRELVEGKVSTTDRRVIFVGLDTYKDEGGKTTDDLFDDRSYLHDEALLDRLVIDQLKDACQDEKENGWKWVELTLSQYLSYEHTKDMTRLSKDPIDLPDGDQSRMDELEDIDRELTPEEAAELETLEARQEGEFSDEQIASAGMFLMIDYLGELKLEGPYVRDDDQDTSQGGSNGSDTITTTRTPDKPVFTQGLHEDLRRIRARAIQAPLIKKRELLLDLLAYTLSDTTLQYPRVINASTQPTAINPDKADGTVAIGTLDDRNPQDRQQSTAETFTAFQELGTRHRNDTLNHALARAFQLPGGSLEAHLAEALGVDVRKHWHPTANGFFKACRGDYLDTLWAKLLELDADDARLSDFAKLKKGEKCKELDDLFNDMDAREAHGLSREQNAVIDTWLPSELTFG